jgi:hypothetical protein
MIFVQILEISQILKLFTIGFCSNFDFRSNIEISQILKFVQIQFFLNS